MQKKEVKRAVLKFLGCCVTVLTTPPKVTQTKLNGHVHLDFSSSAGIVKNEEEDNSEKRRLYA